MALHFYRSSKHTNTHTHTQAHTKRTVRWPARHTIKRAFWLPSWCLYVLYPPHNSSIHHGGEAAISSGKTGNSWHGPREWCSHDAYWSLVAPGRAHKSQGRCLTIALVLQGTAAEVTVWPGTHMITAMWGAEFIYLFICFHRCNINDESKILIFFFSTFFLFFFKGERRLEVSARGDILTDFFL